MELFLPDLHFGADFESPRIGLLVFHRVHSAIGVGMISEYWIGQYISMSKGATWYLHILRFPLRIGSQPPAEDCFQGPLLNSVF